MQESSRRRRILQKIYLLEDSNFFYIESRYSSPKEGLMHDHRDLILLKNRLLRYPQNVLTILLEYGKDAYTQLGILTNLPGKIRYDVGEIQFYCLDLLPVCRFCLRDTSYFLAEWR